MFPIIEKLDDILPHIEQNKQIRVKTEDNGMIVVCYMVQDEDTFAGTDIDWARECRGITFAADGRIAARTLHKFFNVGEHDSVRPEVLPWAQVDRIMEKRDGSMVTPVLTPGAVTSFMMKTKKTFTSKEAALAMEVALSTPSGYDWIECVLQAGMTPTFEITSPKFPIVLKYEKDELTLLHIRMNVSGRYLTQREILALKPPFPIVPDLQMYFYGPGLPALVSWDRLKNAQEKTEDLEGWVIQFKNGDMVKLKTKWYCDLHHAVTFTRWRDIARSVCADQADDLKGAFAMTGRSIEPILKVERAVKAKIAWAQNEVQQRVDFGRSQDWDAKNMAMFYKGQEIFGQIMRTFRGQEVDWIEWYSKNHLDEDWGLEVVGDNE